MMRTTFWLAVALALLTAFGHGLLALYPDRTRLFWHERWAAAWVVGCGAGAFAWFVLSPLYLWVAPIWLLTPLMCALGVGLGRAEALRHERWHSMSRWHSLRVDRWHSPSGLSLSELALSCVLLVQVAALFAAALHTPLGWDGLFNFEMKARLAFEHSPRGQLPREYFADATRIWSHPHYPLLVPFTEFWIYSWLGRVDQSALKVIFPIFYLSLVGFVAGSVRRIADRRAGLMTAVALGVLPPLTLIPGAASGYADVPLAAAFAGATSLAIVGGKEGKQGGFTMAATLSSAAVWTKSEGLMLALVIGVAASVLMRPRPLRLLWFPIVAALPALIFQQWVGYAPGGDFSSVTSMALADRLDRIPVILSITVRELVRPGHWALIWPVFFCLLAAMVVRGGETADRFLAATVLIPVGFYPMVYLFSAWPDVRDHIGTSLPRTLVPLAPIALVFIVRRLYGDSPAEVHRWA